MFCKSREIAIPIRDLALRIRNSALAMNSRKLFSNTSSSLKQVENIYMKQKIPLCVLKNLGDGTSIEIITELMKYLQN